MQPKRRFFGLCVAAIGTLIAVDTAAAQTRVRREPAQGQPDPGRTIRSRSAAPRSGSIRHVQRPTTVQRGDTRVISRTPRYTRIARPGGSARIVSVARPVYGTVIARPLPTFRTVVIGGGTYYCDRDVYYVQRQDRYVVVPPPPGAYVRYLPAEYEEIVVGDSRYFYADDTYYVEDADVEVDIDIDDDDFDIDIDIDIDKERKRRGGYRVVEPPVGAYIYHLPEVYEPVVVRNVTFYRAGGAYYRPVLREGRTAYLRVDLRF